MKRPPAAWDAKPEAHQAALVELTMFIALANLMTRSNTAFGIESQEFASA